jgi:hypothetical protein
MSTPTKKKARKSLLSNRADQDEIAVTSRYWKLPPTAVDDNSDDQLLKLPTIIEEVESSPSSVHFHKDDYEFSITTGVDQLHSAQSTGPVAQRKGQVKTGMVPPGSRPKVPC